MIALLLGLALAEDAGPWETRAMLGGEFDASSHGVLDLGLRRGPWSAQLLTDTLDLGWDRELSRGRLWVHPRAEFGAAGLMISPWTDGAPDPSRALLASYAGPDLGAIRYLRWGFYGGLSAHLRYAWFGATKGTEIAVPEARLWLRGDALLGYWKPSGQAKLSVGADRDGGPIAPHLTFEGSFAPDWPVAPLLELRAGLARDQDLLSWTRLGGLNPYVVPLAGAGWAEWWVQDYAAARVGETVHAPWGRVGIALDHARFDGQQASGFALLAHVQPKRAFVDASAGYAPWIPRGEDVGRLSVWAVAGLDWGRRQKPE